MCRASSVVVVVLSLSAIACGEDAATPIALEADPDLEAPAVIEPAAVEQPPPGGAPPEVARPYDESADAQAQIDAAVASARADGKRVLLMFGANWCVWCRRLTWVFRNEPRVSAALAAGWHVVHVDTGTRGSGTNRAILDRYGDPAQHGLPCLVVLDGEGTLVHTQETGSLESGDRHDPQLVVAFLNRFRSPS